MTYKLLTTNLKMIWNVNKALKNVTVTHAHILNIPSINEQNYKFRNWFTYIFFQIRMFYRKLIFVLRKAILLNSTTKEQFNLYYKNNVFLSPNKLEKTFMGLGGQIVKLGHLLLITWSFNTEAEGSSLTRGRVSLSPILLDKYY